MKEILPVATIWMNLEEITLSEVSQTNYDFPFIIYSEYDLVYCCDNSGGNVLIS